MIVMARIRQRHSTAVAASAVLKFALIALLTALTIQARKRCECEVLGYVDAAIQVINDGGNHKHYGLDTKEKDESVVAR